MLGLFLRAGISFGKTIVGLVTRPYETYRQTVARADLWELVFLAALLSVYFAVSTLMKTASFRPFLLTKQFAVIAMAVGGSFAVTTVLLWLVGRLFGGRGPFRGVLVGWAYSLVPTLLWFLSTSLLYVFLPPPRTDRPLGVFFSGVYLVFSATLFCWKGMLLYLTLRFGMRLDLLRIVGVVVIVGGLLAFYSVGMYRLGIFRVPFL